MSKSQYHVAFLAVCIGVSSYGVTAGKPVLQSKYSNYPMSPMQLNLLTKIVGAFQFPYSETVPFPYPFTTTLFQLICTHICLLCARLFARSINKSLDDLEGRNKGRFAGIGNYTDTKPAFNGAAILRILPLAVTLAAEAALSNYVLYHMPFEAYLLSRVLVIPFLLLLDRFVYTKASAGKLIFPASGLSIAVFLTAFRPELPFSGRILLVGILSSGFSALWLLQLQSRSQSADPLSKGEYAKVNTTETLSNKGDLEIHTTWSLLC
jgi:hypothetical protein